MEPHHFSFLYHIRCHFVFAAARRTPSFLLSVPHRMSFCVRGSQENPIISFSLNREPRWSCCLKLINYIFIQHSTFNKTFKVIIFVDSCRVAGLLHCTVYKDNDCLMCKIIVRHLQTNFITIGYPICKPFYFD